MPNRRTTNDEDNAPRRSRHSLDESRSKGRKKRKQKKNSRRPILLYVLSGVAAVAVLTIGAIILFRPSARRDRDTAAVTNGARGGTGTGPGAIAGTNLLTNGSFEDGPEPDPVGPGFTPLETSSTEIRGWTVTRGSIDYIGPYWQHADGRRSLDLNGNEQGAIAQILRTQPGKKYRVSFNLAGNNCGDNGPPKVVVVTAAGSRAEFSFDASGRTYESMGWVTKTWEFIAVAAETTLEFSSATDLPPACGPALDQVSVVELTS